MIQLLSLLGNKYALWVIIIGIMLSAIGINAHNSSKKQEELDTYKRQVSGKLFDSEQKLQESKHDIGILKSELLTQKDLNIQLKKSKEKESKEFKDFKRRHKLIVRSRDVTIAKLKQQISGISIVTVGSELECKDVRQCLISYDWSDFDNRFKLSDPNIWKDNDEVFESNQIFKIYGEVLAQKNGSLQTRRLILREVRLKPDGTYEPIDGAKANIIKSDFKYSNEPKINIPNKFKLRMITLYGLSAYPFNPDKISNFGLGIEFLHTDRLGLNSHLSLSLEDWSNTDFRLGFSYRPFLDFNIAGGASIGTPVVSLFDSYSLNIDFIFFMNN